MTEIEVTFINIVKDFKLYQSVPLRKVFNFVADK
ncbi:hypothetical protein HNP69_002083 [Chryseobacterium koreense]|nr:hypothetical protein [Chryseobacterium koreense]